MKLNQNTPSHYSIYNIMLVFYLRMQILNTILIIITVKNHVGWLGKIVFDGVLIENIFSWSVLVTLQILLDQRKNILFLRWDVDSELILTLIIIHWSRKQKLSDQIFHLFIFSFLLERVWSLLVLGLV